MMTFQWQPCQLSSSCRDIERYTGIGCPRIHLQLYSAVMHGHRLDQAQMIMLFPLSLSGGRSAFVCLIEPSKT